MQNKMLMQARRAEILQTAVAHGARNIRVFGSTARGEAHAGSDLDLLITLEPGRSLLDLVAIKQDPEDLLGCSVGVVTDASLSPYLRDQVLRDALSFEGRPCCPAAYPGCHREPRPASVTGVL